MISRLIARLKRPKAANVTWQHAPRSVLFLYGTSRLKRPTWLDNMHHVQCCSCTGPRKPNRSQKKKKNTTKKQSEISKFLITDWYAQRTVFYKTNEITEGDGLKIKQKLSGERSGVAGRSSLLRSARPAPPGTAFRLVRENRPLGHDRISLLHHHHTGDTDDEALSRGADAQSPPASFVHVVVVSGVLFAYHQGFCGNKITRRGDLRRGSR